MSEQRSSNGQTAQVGAAQSHRPAALNALAKIKPSTVQDTLTPKPDKPKILFLDDEERILNALNALFRFKYQVFTATDGSRALEILKQHRISLVVSDQRMPNMTGVEFLRQAKEISPHAMRVLLTGFSDLSAIISSVNDGEVYRFVNKPWGNQEIQAIVADAVSISLELENAATLEKSPAVTAGANDGSTPTSQVEPTDAENEAVLIVHDKRALYEEVSGLIGGEHACLWARELGECLEALESKRVAVIVSGLEVGGQDATTLFRLLKREHPDILSIVLADLADADNVIDLINQAKIYRYILMPSKPARVKFYIDSALDQHLRYKSNPMLLRQQKPEISPRDERSPSGSLILNRIRSLRRIFAPRLP